MRGDPGVPLHGMKSLCRAGIIPIYNAMLAQSVDFAKVFISKGKLVSAKAYRFLVMKKNEQVAADAERILLDTSDLVLTAGTTLEQPPDPHPAGIF